MSPRLCLDRLDACDTNFLIIELFGKDTPTGIGLAFRNFVVEIMSTVSPHDCLAAWRLHGITCNRHALAGWRTPGPVDLICFRGGGQAKADYERQGEQCLETLLHPGRLDQVPGKGKVEPLGPSVVGGPTKTQMQNGRHMQAKRLK